jgi:hypothetical protein
VRHSRVCAIGVMTLILSLPNVACSHRPPQGTPMASADEPAKETVIKQETPEGWEPIAVGGLFTFSAPPGIIEKPVQGIDSRVGLYQISDIELGYDYGQYSSTLEEFSDLPGYERKTVVVGGLRAELVRTDSYHQGIAFRSVPGGQKLTVHATYASPESADTVERILLRIQFPDRS